LVTGGHARYRVEGHGSVRRITLLKPFAKDIAKLPLRSDKLDTEIFFFGHLPSQLQIPYQRLRSSLRETTMGSRGNA
jgi:hypothetical protein